MRRLCCFALTLNLLAQSDLPTRLQRAPRLPLQALQVLREDLAKSTDNPHKAYWQSLVEYHLVWKLRVKDAAGAKAMLEQAIARLEPLKDPESLALQGGCLELMIGFNRARAMTLAPKAARLIKEAEQAAPTNPRVKVFWGIHCANIPSLFGGGSARAITALEAAVKLLEAEASQDSLDPLLPRWGRLEAMTWLAETQADSGNKAQGKATIDRVVAQDPEYPHARALQKELQ